MKTNEIIQRMRDMLDYVGHNRTEACVKINRKIHFLNEYQMRAMQAAVMKMTDDEYESFCKSVIIYSGETPENSQYTITIRRNGCLSDPFEKGFYETSDELAMFILRLTPRLK